MQAGHARYRAVSTGEWVKSFLKGQKNMGFDDILPLLFFLIIIVSAIRNVFLKKPDSSKKQSGLGKMFSDFITQIRDELAEAQTTAEQQAEGTGWARPGSYENEPDYVLELKPEKSAAKTIKKEKKPLPLKRNKELINNAQKEYKLAGEMTEGRRRGLQLGSSACGVMEPSVSNLRNAIIWSEILSPPLALRKDREL